MTEATETILLEVLKGLRNDIREFRAEFKAEVVDLKSRMASLESSMVLVKRNINHGDETDARLQVAIDRMNERIDRIEHRLELA
jgi:predicted  nucleic acid-binding Zn-ribbon protein